MNEKAIQRKILNWLRAQSDVWVYKTTGGGISGTSVVGAPDLIGHCRGTFFAFEVKKAGGKLTKIQEHTLNRIVAASAPHNTIQACMVQSLEEVQEAIAELREVL